MNDESRGKKMITAKLDADVHMMLKMLVKRYKTQGRVQKGKVSISDATRFFVEDHDPDIATAAARMTDEQENLANVKAEE